jgi:hypothetical protein
MRAIRAARVSSVDVLLFLFGVAAGLTSLDLVSARPVPMQGIS